MGLYVPRIVDAELDELTAGLAAVSIEGPRAVGKTETALRRVGTAHRLDDPVQLELAAADPKRLTSGEPPILIDEWQRVPYSWDLVRRAVDEGVEAGRFILTGSAAPMQAPSHSGAGRIVTVRMRPLSLSERGLSDPTVSLAGLLGGTRPNLSGGTHIGLQDYTEEVVRSGFPAIRTLPPRLQRAQLDGYIDRIIDHDFTQQGRRVRDRRSLRSWMTAYAAAGSTTASFDTIRDAATPGETNKPAKSTIHAYRRILERLWAIEEVPAWLPTRNRLRRLAASPSHQLADPALSARLLGVGADALIAGDDPGPRIPRDGTLLGVLFQSLVTLSVRTYAQANEARVSHLRTRAGEHEIDLIVERADGRVVALEVKLSATINNEDTRHIHWLAKQIGTDLLDAAIITTGPEAYRRKDGIGVIPAALLTA
ncbi:MAG: DUF4143 domain-containing protein [Acidimicrobiaceae bacterium]|nr:DUF4143 domain-containing protein [Acidimicrobiaceae bacterium]